MVEVDACDEARVYGYDLSGNKELKGYAIEGIELVGTDGVVLLTDGEKKGRIEVGGGAGGFGLAVKVRAEEALSGDEALILEVVNEEAVRTSLLCIRESSCVMELFIEFVS